MISYEATKLSYRISTSIECQKLQKLENSIVDNYTYIRLVDMLKDMDEFDANSAVHWKIKTYKF
jgi:hypothetical protein